MKICPKCFKEHDKIGMYCCRSCANSRNFSKEAIEKKSIASKRSWEMNKEQRLKAAVLNAKAYREKNTLTEEQKNVIKYERNMKRGWYKLGHDARRFVVIFEQGFKCIKCGLSLWMGKPLSLELDHIDGDRYNNARENCECLCPNCHSITDTWRGKHRKKKLNLSDKEIYDTYIKEGNVNNTMKALGLRRAGRTKDRILKAVERYIKSTDE